MLNVLGMLQHLFRLPDFDSLELKLSSSCNLHAAMHSKQTFGEIQNFTRKSLHADKLINNYALLI